MRGAAGVTPVSLGRLSEGKAASATRGGLSAGSWGGPGREAEPDCPRKLGLERGTGPPAQGTGWVSAAAAELHRSSEA